MLVYVFSIQIQTAGQIWMKFGTEVVLKGTKGFFWVGGVDPVPPPSGYRVCEGDLGCPWSLSHAFW